MPSPCPLLQGLTDKGADDVRELKHQLTVAMSGCRSRFTERFNNACRYRCHPEASLPVSLADHHPGSVPRFVKVPLQGGLIHGQGLGSNVSGKKGLVVLRPHRKILACRKRSCEACRGNALTQ